MWQAFYFFEKKKWQTEKMCEFANYLWHVLNVESGMQHFLHILIILIVRFFLKFNLFNFPNPGQLRSSCISSSDLLNHINISRLEFESQDFRIWKFPSIFSITLILWKCFFSESLAATLTARTRLMPLFCSFVVFPFG